MTIQEVRLTRWEGGITKDGRSVEIDYEVQFTGPYHGGNAMMMTSFTPVGLSLVDLSIGSEIDGSSGVYVATRNVRDVNPFGSFTIAVTGNERAADYFENPLSAKDRCTYKRDGQPVEVAYDRNGKLIATYSDPTVDAPSTKIYKPGTKPIEIFGQMPTVPSGKFTASITGYRTAERLGLADYLRDVVQQTDPEKRKDIKIVNAAPVTIAGITWPKESVCFVTGVATPERINGVQVLNHSWELAFDATHDLIVPLMGKYDYDAARADPRKTMPIIDPVTNQPRSLAWPLNSSGKALAAGWTASQVLYLRFALTRAADFSYFGWRF